MVDLTQLVKDWLNGVLPNNGIALVPNAAGSSIDFDSKENAATSHAPRLQIILSGPPAGSSAHIGAARALSVTRPTASTVNVTVTEVSVEDTSNNAFVVRNLNATADINVSGENGLDTGFEAPNTWYYIWVIRRSMDGAVRVLLSASTAAPSLPTGFNQKALISAVRNDESTNFVDFLQRGRRYNYKRWRLAASGNVGNAAWVAINLEPFVPSSLSDFCYGTVGQDNGGSYVTNDSTTPTQATSLASPEPNQAGGDALSSASMMTWQFDVLTPSTIWWTSVVGQIANEVFVHGFEINKI